MAEPIQPDDLRQKLAQAQAVLMGGVDAAAGQPTANSPVAPGALAADAEAAAPTTSGIGGDTPPMMPQGAAIPMAQIIDEPERIQSIRGVIPDFIQEIEAAGGAKGRGRVQLPSHEEAIKRMMARQDEAHEAAQPKSLLGRFAARLGLHDGTKSIPAVSTLGGQPGDIDLTKGGEVPQLPGADPNTDSVPATVKAGDEVIPKREVEQTRSQEPGAGKVPAQLPETLPGLGVATLLQPGEVVKPRLGMADGGNVPVAPRQLPAPLPVPTVPLA